MKIRPYHQTDREAVIDLFRSNTPAFFDPSEEKDLIQYLDNEIEDYFVVEQDRTIIGAGGINYFPEEKTARISWDFISPKAHGKGLGRKLTEHRIHHINANSDVDLIVVRTSQVAYKFYEKMGFQLIRVEKDYWAKNFDLYYMELTNNKV